MSNKYLSSLKDYQAKKYHCYNICNYFFLYMEPKIKIKLITMFQ